MTRPNVTNPARRPLALPLGAALLISAVAYGGSLWGTRIFDDFHSVFDNAPLRDLSNVPGFFLEPTYFSIYRGAGSYRPLTLTTYSLTFAWFGDHLPAFHAGNLLFHLGGVVCLFWLILALLRLLGHEARAETAAAVGATVFGVHPAASQVVHYVSSRSESLAFIGIVGALACHAWSLLPSTSRRGRTVLRGASWLLVAWALCSKETGILVLPLMIAVDLAVVPGLARRLHRRLARLVIPAVVVASYFIWRLLPGLSGFVFGSDGATGATGQRVAWVERSLRALWHYLEMAIFPERLAVWRELPPAPDGAASAWIAGALLVGAVVASVVALLRGGRAAIGLPVLLFFLPLSSYVLRPLELAINENRIYLPLAGLALGVAIFWVGPLQRWSGGRPGRRRVIVIAATGLLALAVARDAVASYVWASETRLWRNAIDVSPHSGDIRAGLGTALMRQGKWEEATRLFEDALTRSPGKLVAIYDNLGIAAYMMGDKESAHRWFVHAYALNPTSMQVLNHLGSILHEMGRPREGLAYLDRAIERTPDYCEPHLEGIKVMQTLKDPGSAATRIAAIPAHCRSDPRVSEVEAWIRDRQARDSGPR